MPTKKIDMNTKNKYICLNVRERTLSTSFAQRVFKIQIYVQHNTCAVEFSCDVPSEEMYVFEGKRKDDSTKRIRISD